MEDLERQHIRQTLHELVGKVGENNAHLLNMQKTLSDHSIERKAIWSKIDEQDEQIKEVKFKVEVDNKVRSAKSGMISLIISTAIAIAGVFWKGQR